MTFNEIKQLTIKDFAEQLVSFNACPRNDGSEEICVVDEDGDMTANVAGKCTSAVKIEIMNMTMPKSLEGGIEYEP